MLPIIILAAALLILVLMVVFSDAATRRRKEKKDWQRDHFHFENICRTTKEAINEVANLDYNEMNLNSEERMKREKQQARLRRATREACQGDAGDRDYLKDYIKDLLEKRLGVDKVTINRIIPFSNPDAMSPVEKFEFMYVLFKKKYAFRVFSLMAEHFGWFSPKPTSDGRFIYSIDDEDIEKAFDSCPYVADYDDQLDVVVQRIYETLYGNDVADIIIMDESLDGVSAGVGGRTRVEYNYLEELIQSDTTKNMSSRVYDSIYCVSHGRTVRLKFLSFRNEETLTSVVKKVYSYDIKKVLSKKNPLLHGTMKNNSRVVVARPPVSDGWQFYIRKFDSADAKHIESLVTHPGRGIVIELLKGIIIGEVNYVVSGEMGSGKTTLQKALIGFMNPQYTIRTAETSFELNLNNLYPERNIHAMQERGDVSIYDILEASKKMDTDVMIVGEVNAPRIAGAFIQVGQSGSKILTSTLHHKTPEALIEYFRNALVEMFGITDALIAEKQIVELLNFDIHTKKDLEGNFYIERITEIIPSYEEPYPEDTDRARREYYKRRTDRHSYRLNELIHFNHDLMRYEVRNTISQYTYDLIAEKVGADVAESLRLELSNAIADPECFDAAYSMKKVPAKQEEDDEYSSEYSNEYGDDEDY